MFEIEKIFFWLKKTFTRKDFLFLLLLVVLYFLTRLINLDKFPIFSDEGIYIHWAKVAWHDASWRFVSLTDGKQPLQTWGTIPFLKIFPDNALLAGRLFSVSTGFVGFLGFFVLLFYLFGKNAAFLGTFLYTLTPYFLFYDRLALVDSGVNAGFIWIFFLSMLLVRTQRLDVALIFGLTSGISLLAKSSVRLFLVLSALAPILILQKNIRKTLSLLANFIPLFALVSFLSLIIYNIQRLSPFFHYVALKNKTFIMTFSEFLQNPFTVFFHNIQIIPQYVFSEAGWVIIIFSLAGLVYLYQKDRKLFSYFILWLLFPFLVIAFFSKVIYPRYLIFFATLLVVSATYFLDKIKKTVLKLIFFSSIMVSFLFYNYTILFNPQLLPFPQIDRGQYIEGVTAVWGAKDLVSYLRQQSIIKPVVVLAEGNFGLVGDVLDVFLQKNEKIFIKGYWPLDEKQLLENKFELAKNAVYVVFAQRKEFPNNWPLKFIKKYEKPANKSAVYLFELIK